MAYRNALSDYLDAPMPENYLRNNITGAVYDLGQSQSGPALDFASGPVEYMGQKGYRVKGDPFTVVMADGSRLKLGQDVEATQRMQANNLKLLTDRVKYEEEVSKLNDLTGSSGGAATSAQVAAALGVPQAPASIYAGMSRKGREALQAKEITQAEKRLAEEESTARAQGALAMDAQRFKDLNAVTDTGPVKGSSPVAWLRSLDDSNISEMQSIQSRLTPKMREPGSGATSDFDAKMFQQALFGMNKNKDANDAIANAMILKAKAEKERVAFMGAYLQANNTLRGADSAWSNYANDNPIFDPASQTPSINASRVSWQDYFSGRRAPVDQAKPAQPASSNDGWSIKKVP